MFAEMGSHFLLYFTNSLEEINQKDYHMRLALKKIPSNRRQTSPPLLQLIIDLHPPPFTFNASHSSFHFYYRPNREVKTKAGVILTLSQKL